MLAPSLRPWPMTRALLAFNASTMAAPMPRVAPVTRMWGTVMADFLQRGGAWPFTAIPGT